MDVPLKSLVACQQRHDIKMFVLGQNRASGPGILDLSNELLDEIGKNCVYSGPEFGTEIEYEDEDTRGNIPRMQHALCRVNRRFYHTFAEIRWYNVVAQSERDLRCIAASSSKYGRLTRRFELAPSDSYDSALIPAILEDMKGLEVFVLRSTEYYDKPTVIIESLSRCPRLKRVQFDSTYQPPSDLSLKVVLNTLPNLVALHVSGFEPQASNAVVDWVGKNPLPNEFALRTLSIGRTQHRLIGRSLYTERACDMFIAMFTDGGCSSRIQHFNMLSFSPLIIPFLENWGPSLKTLTFELPMRYHSEDRHQPKLVEHCNGLEEVTFLARSISRTKTSPALPDKLPTVRLVKLICRAPQPRYDLPRVSTFIQNLLHDLRDGDYPELESVHIELQGDGVPCLESSIWFQALKRIWRTSKRDEAGKTKPMRIDFK